MIKKPLFFFLCLCTIKSNADTPGKQPMSESKISIQNITRLAAYDFYWQVERDSVALIKGDTTVLIPSSGGAPYNAAFWGINKTTNKSTDTLSFENYYAPDYLVMIDTIDNNKFRYTKKEISNNNAGGVSGDKDDVAYAKTNSTKIIMFSAISLIALILLVWYFIRKKNTTQDV